MEARKLARWNGVAWSAIDNGIDDDNSYGAYVLREFRGDLIVTGEIATIRNVPFSGIARWDGTHGGRWT